MTNETSVTDASETTLRGAAPGHVKIEDKPDTRKLEDGVGSAPLPRLEGRRARAGLSSPGWMTLLVAKITPSLFRVHFACRNTFRDLRSRLRLTAQALGARTC
jgi:hypothetical protein